MIDFVGIGAQKSATSWIYESMCMHKDICIPIKEMHFFSRDRYKNNGIKWYDDKFNDCNSKIKGEFSTSYLYTKLTANRIYQYNPDIKIIISLRDPVRRAFSNYLNDIMAGDVSKNTSFRESLKVHHEYLEQGYYYQQIKEYLKYFDKRQIHIILFEDIRNDSQDVLLNLFKFLDIPMKNYHELSKEATNVSRIPKNAKLEKIMYIMAQFMSNNMQWLYKAIKKTNIHNLVRKINSEQVKPVLLESDYNELIKLFIEDMKYLKIEFDLDISKWKY